MSESAPDLRRRTADLSTLGSGAGVALVGRVAGRATQVVCEVLLARFLGPAVFGLYAAGWALLRVVGLIAPLGLDKGVVRFGAGFGDRPGRMKGLIYEAMGVALSVGLVLGLTFYVASDWLAGSVFQKPGLAPVLRGFAPAVALLVGLRVAAAITRVTCKMHHSVLAEDLAPTIVNLALIGVVYWAGLGLVGAVFACTASLAVAFVLSLVYVVRLYPEVRDRAVAAEPSGRALFTFSLATSLAGVSTLVMIWVDRLLMAWLRTPAELGIYQAATQPAFVFSTILVSFNAVLVPMIAGLEKQGDRERMGELFRVSTKWGLYLSVPPFLLICFAPEALIGAVFGPSYLPGVLPMLLLSAGQLVNAGTGAVGALLIMTGNQKRWMVATFGFLMVGVTLNLALIPRYGMIGAAAASSSAIAALFVTGLFLVRHALGLWPYDRRYGKGALAGAAAVAGLFAVRSAGWTAPWPSLAAHGFLAGGVFFGGLWVLGLDPEDRELVRLIRARIQGGAGMNGSDDVKVLYIAGWGRSGSTILTNLLGQVPGFFSGGELRYLWERNLSGGHDCGCGAAFLDCEIWREVVERSGAARLEHDMGALLAAAASDRAIPALMSRRGSARILASLGPGASTLAGLYRAIRNATGSSVIVDSSKVPSYAALLARVPGLDVRVLHLVRDPRAVAWSWLRKKMQKDVGREMIRRSAFESAWRWAVRNAEVRLFWKSADTRFLRMRYETVIDRPEASLQRILEFAGEPEAPLPFVAPGVAEMQRTHSSSGNPNRFQTGRIELRRDDEWRGRMSRRDRLTVTALTWPQLLAYGYAPRRKAESGEAPRIAPGGETESR